MAVLYCGLQKVTPVIGGGGGSQGKYQLLQRIKDDSNNEIGTVCGFFTDANDVEYAVVCLDAQYRLASGQWCSSSGAVTNMPTYNSVVSRNVWAAKETATTNTQLILDFCTANNYTSSACTHCRSKSFTIGGTVYYGQLPNLGELSDFTKYYPDIESKDTSASSYTSLNFSSGRQLLSSSQYNANNAWCKTSSGTEGTAGKTSNRFVCPVLELPNA